METAGLAKNAEVLDGHMAADKITAPRDFWDFKTKLRILGA